MLLLANEHISDAGVSFIKRRLDGIIGVLVVVCSVPQRPPDGTDLCCKLALLLMNEITNSPLPLASSLEVRCQVHPCIPWPIT